MGDVMSNQIRVRFAPSPTGYLHVGGLRTALYNYLYAKKVGGKFILRIEDTDQTRYVEGAVENLINSLKIVGLEFDEGPKVEGDFGPYFQSERTEIYKQHIDELLGKNAAYRCFCTSENLDKMRTEQKAKGLDTRYDGRCRHLSKEKIEQKITNGEKFVVRLKVPQEGEITFYDVVRDKITFPWEMVDDQVLMKSDGFPTYHLANVIDDHLMEISHIIRGEEWLSSVPKHLFLYEQFGWKPPKMAHLPLLLNSDKSKLSKRQGDVAVEDYLAKGFLPETLINFVALLGWHASGDREIFALKELEKEFSLKRVNKAGAVFDIDKLKWMNGQYLRTLELNYIVKKAIPFLDNFTLPADDKLRKIVDFGRNRVSTLAEIENVVKPFFSLPKFDDEAKEIIAKWQNLFKFWVENLEQLDQIRVEDVNNLLKESTKKVGVKGKNLYFPLRLVLFGSVHGPELPEIFEILGKIEILTRFKNVIGNV